MVNVNVTISIPEELKATIENHNKAHPCSKIPVSAVCQEALNQAANRFTCDSFIEGYKSYPNKEMFETNLKIRGTEGTRWLLGYNLANQEELHREIERIKGLK